ncbi:MAG: pilin [Candidatus Doudnabacteria bacterium]|nr:pilin [Candidatus Doudnabacteria bacterium]
MKSRLKKIYYSLLILPLLAVTVPNPDQDLFSVKFGTDFRSIITGVLELALGFAGLIAVAYIILGGYQIATARGNEEMAKNGRKTLTNAIIGLVIIIMAYVIVAVVVNAAFGNVKGGNPALAPSDGGSISI